MSDLGHWRQELENFVKGDAMVLAIPYEGPDPNPRRFWACAREPESVPVRLAVVPSTFIAPPIAPLS